MNVTTGRGTTPAITITAITTTAQDERTVKGTSNNYQFVTPAQAGVQ